VYVRRSNYVGLAGLHHKLFQEIADMAAGVAAPLSLVWRPGAPLGLFPGCCWRLHTARVAGVAMADQVIGWEARPGDGCGLLMPVHAVAGMSCTLSPLTCCRSCHADREGVPAAAGRPARVRWRVVPSAGGAGLLASVSRLLPLAAAGQQGTAK
jgi:hypothetical protein